MIKIAYLHGLESNNCGPKNDWLRTFSDVYDPLSDYYETGIYQTLKSEILDFQPELIIGSSMGGFFAYQISKELDIKTVLFNPALHSRSVEPDMTGFLQGNARPKTHAVFGICDDVIDPFATENILKKEGNPNLSTIFFTHGHGTPLEVFMSETNKFTTVHFVTK